MTALPDQHADLSARDDVTLDLVHAVRNFEAKAREADEYAEATEKSAQENRQMAQTYRAKAEALTGMLAELGIDLGPADDGPTLPD